MNTKMVIMTLAQNQAAMLAGLALAEAQRMRNRVPSEDRTPLFLARLDDLDWVAHVLIRAAGYAE